MNPTQRIDTISNGRARAQARAKARTGEPMKEQGERLADPLSPITTEGFDGDTLKRGEKIDVPVPAQERKKKK